MRKAALSLVLLLASTPALALAQPGTGQAAQPPPAGSPAATSAMITVPPPPAVDDPMLGPVPPPTRMLGSWQQAMELLRARSTDLRIALDQVLQAEAQTRIALAQYLPTITGNARPVRSTGWNTKTTPTIGGIGGLSVSTNGVVPASRVPIPNTAAGTIQLTQDVINLPEFDQISINELGEDAARLSVDQEKRTLALSVANQIVAVVTAEREAEINRVGLRVALEQAEISVRKRALGAANGLDVVRAKQNAANARASLVTGDESLREAREALASRSASPKRWGSPWTST